MKKTKNKCEAGSHICSGELIQKVKVDGETCHICGACLVYYKLRVDKDGNLKGRRK